MGMIVTRRSKIEMGWISKNFTITKKWRMSSQEEKRLMVNKWWIVGHFEVQESIYKLFQWTV